MSRIVLFAGLSSLAAAVALAAPADKGSAPEPIEKADPAPAPLSADERAPAEPQPDPAPGAEGNAPDADPNPPVNAKDAKAAAKEAGAKAPPKVVHMVWAQPGHEQFGIGMMLRMPAELGERIRSVGRARYASEAEIKAAGKDVPLVESV